jgi:TatD DNase family protein
MIDSHAHLGDEQFADDLPEVLERASILSAVIDICTDLPTLKTGLRLAEEYPWIHLAAATTPHDVESDGENFFPHVEEVARAGKLVAIGETGLDYFYEHSPRDLQQHFLRRYLQLAMELSLPIVIHCRDAFADLFRIFDEEGYRGRGVCHCFTGTLEEAKEAISRGFCVSFSGIVTFKKSHDLREVARQLPLDSILIETDAPYLAPQSHRGKRCEPAFVQETASMLAEVLGLSPEDVGRACATNACELFRLHPRGTR